jgi:hypothetical protein
VAHRVFFADYGDKALKSTSSCGDSVFKSASSTFHSCAFCEGPLLQSITDRAQTDALAYIDITTFTVIIVFFMAFSPIGKPTIAILCLQRRRYKTFFQIEDQYFYIKVV